MHKRMAIFPVDFQNVALVRNSWQGGYEAVALVAPALSVLDGADVAELDGGAKTDIILHADYTQQISESDIAYFLESELVTDIQTYQALISYADRLGKKVLVSPKLSKLLGNKGRKDEGDSIEQEGRDLATRLLPIDIPIISIFAMGENCGQGESELSARKYFLGKGYNVLQFGTEGYCSLLGCREFPSFLFDASVDVNRRIILFNQYIYRLCREERPDLLIMGVPKPIMKYNDDILNGFGMIPLIVQSGIRSDIGLVNMYYGQYNYEFLTYMMNYCKFRLGIETRYFGISNTSSSQNVEIPNKLDYLSLSVDFVNANLDASIGGGDYIVFPIFDEEKRRKAFKDMENELL